MGLSTGEFLVDDVRLAYRTSGSGVLLLILPGNTASSAYHTGELEHFGERFHAVSESQAPNLQNPGLSDSPLDRRQQMRVLVR